MYYIVHVPGSHARTGRSSLRCTSAAPAPPPPTCTHHWLAAQVRHRHHQGLPGDVRHCRGRGGRQRRAAARPAEQRRQRGLGPVDCPQHHRLRAVRPGHHVRQQRKQHRLHGWHHRGAFVCCLPAAPPPCWWTVLDGWTCLHGWINARCTNARCHARLAVRPGPGRLHGRLTFRLARLAVRLAVRPGRLRGKRSVRWPPYRYLSHMAAMQRMDDTAVIVSSPTKGRTPYSFHGDDGCGTQCTPTLRSLSAQCRRMRSCTSCLCLPADPKCGAV